MNYKGNYRNKSIANKIAELCHCLVDHVSTKLPSIDIKCCYLKYTYKAITYSFNLSCTEYRLFLVSDCNSNVK